MSSPIGALPFRALTTSRLFHHSARGVAELAVIEVLSAVHILTDLTFVLGKVAHDYLA